METGTIENIKKSFLDDVNPTSHENPNYPNDPYMRAVEDLDLYSDGDARSARYTMD